MIGDGLSDLYGDVLLDHGRRPRNRRAQECPPASVSEGHNPLCGDRVRVYVKLDGDRVADVSFEGQGCAISQASASMMTQAVVGKSVDEAAATLARFQSLVTGAPNGAGGEGDDLGELVALGGVRAFPMRVKCATLAWHALKTAIAEARTDRSAPTGRATQDQAEESR